MADNKIMRYIKTNWLRGLSHLATALGTLVLTSIYNNSDNIWNYLVPNYNLAINVKSIQHDNSTANISLEFMNNGNRPVIIESVHIVTEWEGTSLNNRRYEYDDAIQVDPQQTIPFDRTISAGFWFSESIDDSTYIKRKIAGQTVSTLNINVSINFIIDKTTMRRKFPIAQIFWSQHLENSNYVEVPNYIFKKGKIDIYD